MAEKKNSKARPATTTHSPIDLEVVDIGEGFALTLAGETLLSAQGKYPLVHPAPQFLEHIASEFDGHGKLKMAANVITEPKFFGAYALFSIQKEFVESGQDDLALNFEAALLGDPLLHRVAGPEQVHQIARWEPVLRWLGSGFSDLSRLAWSNALARTLSGYGLDDEMDATPQEPSPEDLALSERGKAHVDALARQYRALAPEERTVVMYLYALNHGHVLFPMALVLGHCTGTEYAQGVMAGDAMMAEVFADVSEEDHRSHFNELRGNARTAMEYIQFYRAGLPSQRLRDLITQGEGIKLEFKSTLRWNIRAEKHDEAITHACIKTIGAFLNTDGGNLLIGVADNGGIVGIEKDGFPNSDKFLLHLRNLIKSAFGEAASTLVDTEVVTVGEYTVCMTTCRRSREPVYCRLKGGEEHFYVRTGPSTAALSPSEMTRYIREHFTDA